MQIRQKSDHAAVQYRTAQLSALPRGKPNTRSQLCTGCEEFENFVLHIQLSDIQYKEFTRNMKGLE